MEPRVFYFLDCSSNNRQIIPLWWWLSAMWISDCDVFQTLTNYSKTLKNGKKSHFQRNLIFNEIKLFKVFRLLFGVGLMPKIAHDNVHYKFHRAADSSNARSQIVTAWILRVMVHHHHHRQPALESKQNIHTHIRLELSGRSVSTNLAWWARWDTPSLDEPLVLKLY